MKKLCISTGKILIFFVGFALLAGMLPIPGSSNGAVWRFWAELIPFFTIVGLTLLFWLFEKRKVQLHVASSPLRNCVIGFATGAIWLGTATVILISTGTMKILEEISIPMLWLWILSVFINTIMQELLVRGYLFQMLKANYNVIVATIITTALFTFMHGGAFAAGIVPVLNVLTMSLLMTIVLEYTQSLLAPIMMHFTWNCFGGIILGGVSLADDYPHLYSTEFTGNVLLSGGTLKMEGSIVVLILNIMLILGFAFLLKKRHH